MSSLKLTNVRLRIDIHASQDVHFLIDALSWQKNWETWSLGFSGADSERLRCCSSDPTTRLHARPGHGVGIYFSPPHIIHKPWRCSSRLRLESRSSAEPLVTDASNMNTGQSAADRRNRHGRKAYSVSVQSNVQSGTSCSFCWLVLALNPTLEGMNERDSATFKAHLEKTHGLRNEIQP